MRIKRGTHMSGIEPRGVLFLDSLPLSLYLPEGVLV